MDKVASMIYDELVDMSNLSISSHAITQYNIKCFPFLSVIEVVEQMRRKLKGLKKIDVSDSKKKNHPNSEYYIDDDDIVYVIANNKVITTYPNNRIFKAKPLFSSKKMGRKWL